MDEFPLKAIRASERIQATIDFYQPLVVVRHQAFVWVPVTLKLKLIN